jgi:ATP-dependent DNA helicase PIF1
MSEIKLNDQQHRAYELIRDGHNVFLTGSAGTGKSVVINYYKDRHSIWKKIAITSTTGVSALVIGGSTLHSYLGIGLGNDTVDKLYNKIIKRPAMKKRWKNLEVLIIDEVSMLSPELFDKLEVLARMIRKIRNVPDCPFGGIQLVLTGDFLQLPVVKSDNFVFESESWNKCIDHTIYLTEIMRQKDIEFQTVLNEIRFGIVSDKGKRLLSSRIKKNLMNDLGIRPTRIYTTNESVDVLNSNELDKLNLSENYFEYDMDLLFTDTNLTARDRDNYTEKFAKNCIAPINLKLCLGAQVMLLYNLSVDEGLVNGSRGIVVEFIENIPVVQFLNGIRKLIDVYSWEVKDGEDLICYLTQIPLKLAWAFTVHKSQAITLDYAEVDLSNLFTYGQAYVALSRVKNIEGLSIVNINFDKIKAHPKAVQFYEALLNIKNEYQPGSTAE